MGGRQLTPSKEGIHIQAGLAGLASPAADPAGVWTSFLIGALLAGAAMALLTKDQKQESEVHSG
jgi:hypothetical protein